MSDNKWHMWLYKIPYDTYMSTEILGASANSYEDALEIGLQEALDIIE